MRGNSKPIIITTDGIISGINPPFYSVHLHIAMQVHTLKQELLVQKYCIITSLLLF